MVEHILLHCSVARDLCSLVFALFGVSGFMLKMVIQMSASAFMTRFNNHRHVKICKTVPLFCGLFGEKGIAGPSVMGHPTCVLKSFVLRSLYDLIIALGNFPFVSFLDFLDSLNCSLYF